MLRSQSQSQISIQFNPPSPLSLPSPISQFPIPNSHSLENDRPPTYIPFYPFMTHDATQYHTLPTTYHLPKCIYHLSKHIHVILQHNNGKTNWSAKEIDIFTIRHSSFITHHLPSQYQIPFTFPFTSISIFQSRIQNPHTLHNLQTSHITKNQFSSSQNSLNCKRWNFC